MMRTTFDIEPALVDEIKQITGERSASKAIALALAEYIRRRRIEEIIAMAGTLQVEDDWQELEELEMEEMKRTEKRRWS
jgi:hypothetical protein